MTVSTLAGFSYERSHMLPFCAGQYISFIYHFIYPFFMTAIWRILL